MLGNVTSIIYISTTYIILKYIEIELKQIYRQLQEFCIKMDIKRNAMTCHFICRRFDDTSGKLDPFVIVILWNLILYLAKFQVGVVVYGA